MFNSMKTGLTPSCVNTKHYSNNLSISSKPEWGLLEHWTFNDKIAAWHVIGWGDVHKLTTLDSEHEIAPTTAHATMQCLPDIMSHASEQNVAPLPPPTHPLLGFTTSSPTLNGQRTSYTTTANIILGIGCLPDTWHKRHMLLLRPNM